MKVIIIIAIVAVILVGLMLTLRTTRNAGMPSEEVLKRAEERARAQAAAEKDAD